MNEKDRREVRGVLLAIATVLLVTAGLVYALTSLTVNNSASITAGSPNLFMVTGVTSTTVCSTATGYANSGLSINWGAVSQGSSNHQFVCLENTGSPHALSISNNLPTADGSISTPANGQTVASNGFLLIDFNWSVDPSAPTTSAISFSITVA